jgi:regulatory protein
MYPEEPDALGLCEGSLVDETLREELEWRRQRYFCREKAVELLARREHSSAELERKLLQREFSPAVIEPVLEELRQKRWLDDERFARMYAETRLRRKAMGAGKLVEELTRKGVPREVTERTVAEYCTEQYQREAVEEAARKALRRVGENREKLLRALRNRGFAMEYIRSCSVFQQLGGGE